MFLLHFMLPCPPRYLYLFSLPYFHHALLIIIRLTQSMLSHHPILLGQAISCILYRLDRGLGKKAISPARILRQQFFFFFFCSPLFFSLGLAIAHLSLTPQSSSFGQRVRSNPTLSLSRIIKHTKAQEQMCEQGTYKSDKDKTPLLVWSATLNKTPYCDRWSRL